jgi:hypothetical protein
MNFDYTSIVLLGLTIYEPMVIVTNFILFLLCLFVFRSLKKYQTPYSKAMSTFILIMGISGCFGAFCHAVHYQLGKPLFDVVFYISNALNLICVYYCFMGSYAYQSRGKTSPNKYAVYGVKAWIVLMLIITLLWNNFLLIKTHAGLVLVYSLIVHLIFYGKNKERGSAIVAIGIFVSFFSIIVHSLHFSLHEYFNYKDIAHVIMIMSLAVIYKGIKINSEQMSNL